MEDDEDFLAAIEADNKAEPIAEPDVLELTQEAEPAPVEEPTPELPEVKPEPVMVPLAALHETRDKVKTLEAQIAAMRPQPEAPAPQSIPDVFEDPEAYAAYNAQISAQGVMNAKLDISEEMARDKFGDEVVDTARDWALQAFQARPGFYAEVMQQRNPYRYVVEQHAREQVASQVSPDDFKQFQAWKAAQAGLLAPTPTPANPIAPRTVVPPRSLASAPSAGGIATEIEPDEDDIFEGAFKRK